MQREIQPCKSNSQLQQSYIKSEHLVHECTQGYIFIIIESFSVAHSNSKISEQQRSLRLILLLSLLRRRV